jgi:hypothetical protein
VVSVKNIRRYDSFSCFFLNELEHYFGLNSFVAIILFCNMKRRGIVFHTLFLCMVDMVMGHLAKRLTPGADENPSPRSGLGSVSHRLLTA